MKKYLIYISSLVAGLLIVIFGAMIFLWTLPNNVIEKPNQEMFNRSTQLLKHAASTSSATSVNSSSSSSLSAGDKVVKSLTGKTLDDANTYANKKDVQVIIMTTVKGTSITRAILNSAGLLLYMN